MSDTVMKMLVLIKQMLPSARHAVGEVKQLLPLFYFNKYNLSIQPLPEIINLAPNLLTTGVSDGARLNMLRNMCEAYLNDLQA